MSSQPPTVYKPEAGQTSLTSDRYCLTQHIQTGDAVLRHKEIEISVLFARQWAFQQQTFLAWFYKSSPYSSCCTSNQMLCLVFAYPSVLQPHLPCNIPLYGQWGSLCGDLHWPLFTLSLSTPQFLSRRISWWRPHLCIREPSIKSKKFISALTCLATDALEFVQFICRFSVPQILARLLVMLLSSFN